LQHTSKATIENERDYLELKNDIEDVKQLQKQTIDATKKIRATHKQLLREIEMKRNLEQTIKELQELYESIKELNSTVKKIDTNK
jgi:methyl-accepting chemotaxis protein